MKLEDKIAKIVERADGMRKIAEIIRVLENQLVESNTVLEAISDLLDGKEVSDFMLSFPIVRQIDDLIVDSDEVNKFGVEEK